MAKFGLVCEGITDQIVIENILYGMYSREYEDIDDEIQRVQPYKEKIIFAISVHSLECWLFSIYSKSEKIHTCEDKLKKEVIKVSKKLKMEKNYKNYDKLSQDFLKYKQLIKIASKNTSFQIFIDKLPNEL